MTVIIAAVDKKNKNIVMGADKCASNSMQKFTIGEEAKIFQPHNNPNFVIGFAGDPRVKQILTNNVPFPTEEELAVSKRTVNEEFLVRTMIPIFQAILKENGYIDACGILGDIAGSQLVFAYKDRLWTIGPGFQLFDHTDSDYATVGSGSFVAQGSMEALLDCDTPLIDDIVKSLKIASKLAMGVEGPYDIFVTGKGKLSPDVLKSIVDGSLKLKEEEYETTHINFVKKVVEKDLGLEDLINPGEEIEFYATKDRSKIFFVDYNGDLYALKDNTNIVRNIQVVDDLKDVKFDIVELKPKAMAIIEGCDFINLTKPEEEPEEENDLEDVAELLSAFGIDLDSIIEQKMKAAMSKLIQEQPEEKEEPVEEEKVEEKPEEPIVEEPVEAKPKRKRKSKKAIVKEELPEDLDKLDI